MWNREARTIWQWEGLDLSFVRWCAERAKFEADDNRRPYCVMRCTKFREELAKLAL